MDEGEAKLVCDNPLKQVVISEEYFVMILLKFLCFVSWPQFASFQDVSVCLHVSMYKLADIFGFH